MLTAIEIENFKAFGESVRIDLRPITLLFGPNSGGKSTILHALHYAREIMLRGNCDVTKTESGSDLVDLGGIRRLVHGRILDGRTITLRFELDLTNEPFELSSDFDLMNDAYGSRTIDEAVSRVESAAVILRVPAVERPIVSEYAVELNGVAFASIQSMRGKPQSQITVNWRHPVLFNNEMVYTKEMLELREKAEKMRLFAEDRGLDDIASQIREIQEDVDSDIETHGVFADIFGQVTDELPLAAHSLEVSRLKGGIPDWDNPLYFDSLGDIHAEHTLGEFLTQMIVEPGRILRDNLESFRYLGPLRSIPPRRLEKPDPVGYSRWPLGLAAWDLLTDSDQGELLEEVSKWLWEEGKLDTGFRLTLQANRSLDEGTIHRMIADQEFYDEEDSVDIDMYPGISDIPRDYGIVLEDTRRGIKVDPYDVGVGLSQLVPAIVCALDKRVPLVAMEQPELHLHPSQQAALGDLLIEGIRGDRNRTIIVETHSEHLILRLLRRVRETSKQVAFTKNSLSADQLRVLYVSPQGTPSSQILEMHVDIHGNFVEPWPDDFFEQDFKERFPNNERQS